MAGHRSKDSYRGRTPEARQRQIENLHPGRKPGEIFVSRRVTDAMLERVDIIEFAESFLQLKLYPAQKVILKAIYGIALDTLFADEFKIFRELVGGVPMLFMTKQQAVEVVLALGARSGKSFLASIIALYEATRPKWRQYLRSNERGFVVVVATRLQQAQDIIQRNCSTILENSRLRHLISDSFQATLNLTNNMSIMSIPCNSTAGRGLPICTLILDEIAHYSIEGTKADSLIFNSLRPRLAQFPGAKTVLISTPSAKQGIFWDFFKEGPQVPGRVTMRASTQFMNPEIDLSFLEREMKRDADNYAREFLAQFCETMSTFLPADKLDAAFILPGDISPNPIYAYGCGVDQSGFSGKDAFGFAIAHEDQAGKIIVDVARSWQTQDMDQVLEDIDNFRQYYGLMQAMPDRYAAGWCSQSLNRIGLEVVAGVTLAELFINFKSLILAGRIALPENPDIRMGFLRTECFFGRNNALSISHERTDEGHSDICDAIVRAVWQCSRQTLEIEPSIEVIGQYEVPELGVFSEDEKRYFSME